MPEHTVLAWNANSLHGDADKRLDFVRVVAEAQPAVVAVVESRLTPSSHPFRLPGYAASSFHHQEPSPPHRAHGGILLLVRRASLPIHRVRPDLSFNLAPAGCADGAGHRISQAVCLEARLGRGPTALFLFVYVHPSEHALAWPPIEDCIDRAQAAAGPLGALFVLGDFNAHHPAWNAHMALGARTSSAARAIADCMEERDLACLNALHAPGVSTRRASSHSIIDLAFTSRPELVASFDVPRDVFDWDDSDHFPLRVVLDPRGGGPRDPPADDRRHGGVRWRVGDMDDQAWSSFEHDVSAHLVAWARSTAAAVEDGHFDIDEAWRGLRDVMLGAARRCVGVSRPTARSKHWWGASPELQPLHRAYKRAWKAYLRVRSQPAGSADVSPLAAHAVYRAARAAFRRAMRRAKARSWEQLTAKIEDPLHRRLVWKAWARSQPSDSFAPTSIASSGRVDLPADVADSLDRLAAHFADTCSHPRHPTFDAQHEDVVAARVAAIALAGPGAPGEADAQGDALFELGDLVEQIKRLRRDTAPGHDSLSPHFIQRGGEALHRALLVLFNASWSSGRLPRDWKRANVLALYKGKGADRADPSSYRPISLTSVVVRLFERLIKRRLLARLPADFLHPLQSGFRAGHSTYDSLLYLHFAVKRALVQRRRHEGVRGHPYLPVCFVDISKAFDKVWHDGLLAKLHDAAGIRGRAWTWIRDFLSARQMRVVHGDRCSRWFGLSAGVPQGSVLAPLLFLVFINDLAQAVSDDGSRTATSMFADDLAIWPCSDGALRDPLPGMRGARALQAALDRLHAWCRLWRVRLSLDKTQVVVFRRGARSLVPRPLRAFHFRLGHDVVGFADRYHYMGVTFASDGRWSHQLARVVCRAAHSAHLIGRIVTAGRGSPSFGSVRTLVHSVLRAQIAYGLPFWLPGDAGTRKLQSVLVRPLRRVLGHLPVSTHQLSLLLDSGSCPLGLYREFLVLRHAARWFGLAADHPARQLFVSAVERAREVARDGGRDFALRSLLWASRDPVTRTLADEAVDVAARWGVQLDAALDVSRLRSALAELLDAEWQRSVASGSGGATLHGLVPRVLAVGRPARYLVSDPAEVAGFRARMRLRRVRTNAYVHSYDRRHSPLCEVCRPAVDESIVHVLSDCVRFGPARDRMVDDLFGLDPVRACFGGSRQALRDVVLSFDFMCGEIPGFLARVEPLMRPIVSAFLRLVCHVRHL